jgi:hypothetical protein
MFIFLKAELKGELSLSHLSLSFLLQIVISIVIKPGPARRVDPGPGRPGGWTGPGLIKDRLLQQPGQTRATRRVDPEPG